VTIRKKRYNGKPDPLLPLKAKVGNAKIIDKIPNQVWDNSMR